MTHFVPLSSHSLLVSGKYYWMKAVLRTVLPSKAVLWDCTQCDTSWSRTCSPNSEQQECERRPAGDKALRRTLQLVSAPSEGCVCDAKVHIKRNDIADRDWARQKRVSLCHSLSTTHTHACKSRHQWFEHLLAWKKGGHFWNVKILLMLSTL